MAKAKSAGILLYRKNRSNEYEVLIVHPSGDKNAAWSIPKGRLDKDETPKQAAIREVFEETGIVVSGELDSLGSVIYKSKKKVYCFCTKAPTTKPVCANWEIDQAKFVSLDEAESMLHVAQSEFIKRFKIHLKKCVDSDI